MLHLLKYSFLSKVRNFNIIFWPLVFPLVLGTFFYFAFGNINEADFQTVPVAVVKEDSADPFFMTYLDEVKKSSPDLLKAEEMPEKEALEALQDKQHHHRLRGVELPLAEDVSRRITQQQARQRRDDGYADGIYERVHRFRVHHELAEIGEGKGSVGIRKGVQHNQQ